MTTLADWLDERERLAKAAVPGPWRVKREEPEFMLPYDAVIASDGNRSRCCIYTQDAAFIADARESLPRLVEMVRVLHEALRRCEREATEWQESQESAAYNLASAATQVEVLEQIGELHSRGVNVAVTDAIRRVEAIAAESEGVT